MEKPVEASDENPLIEDRISQLHHDILVRIISFLTLKEAARTSVLSKSWTDIWKSIHRLHFDIPEVCINSGTFYRPDERASLLESQGYKHAEWINKALQSHKAFTLEEFKMCIRLGRSMQEEIDKWLCYAFAKKVQRLELETLSSIREPYVFPEGLLDLSNETTLDKSFSIYCGNYTPIDILGGFKSIRSLRLSCVSVTGDVFKMFLREFQFLEHLAIHGSHDLTSVEVCGSSIALQRLELCLCTKLQSVIVSDINLVSLKVSGCCELILKNVPKLRDLCILERFFEQTFSLLSGCLENLEILTLDVWDYPKTEHWIHKVPQPNRLKQLNFSAPPLQNEGGLIVFAYLVGLFPNLEKFVLKLRRAYSYGIESRALIRAPSLPLQHLKVFEVHGYQGRGLELELVKYFVENAMVLERLTVEPQVYKGYGCTEVARLKAKRQFEELKKQLEELIPNPSCIDLVVF
ncbi:OLC1v1011738C4 [Oldenlandia corymbosa var. corymbosa]|nr:OLC1v1011738C4 [Oldenlandia corymbosa var. corymbosa]